MLEDGTIAGRTYNTDYEDFQVEGAVAFSGGIVMDEEGNLYANRDYQSNEPLPKLDIMESR